MYHQKFLVLSLLVFSLIFCSSSLRLDQIGFPNFIQLHWGKCCNIHHVISLDVSGSMYPWGGTTQKIISNWQDFLQKKRATSNIWVSAHQFNHVNIPWGQGVIRKGPIKWNSSSQTPGGGTQWSHSIQFLTNQLNNSRHKGEDDICFTMITDVGPDGQLINAGISSEFWSAYNKWKKEGCQLCARIIDVRSLPMSPMLKSTISKEETGNDTGPKTIKELFTSAKIPIQSFTPKSIKEFEKYYNCKCGIKGQKPIKDYERLRRIKPIPIK